MGTVYKRGDSYYVDYRSGGKRHKKSVGNISRSDALDILKELEGRAVRARVGDLLDNEMEVADLMRSYLAFAEQTLRPKSFRRVSDNLNTILGQLKVKLVSQITQDSVIAFRKWRLGQTVKKTKRHISARTVNMEVTALSTLLNYGVKHRMIHSNPIRGLKQLSMDVRFKERRALTVEEVASILAASTDHFRPIWRALLSTGMRSSELAALRFKDVDWTTREFIVRPNRAKNHRGRRIPIMDEDVWADLVHRFNTAKDRVPGKGNTPNATERIAAKFTKQHVYVTKVNTPLGNNLRARFYATCERAGVNVSGLEDGQGNAVDIHALRGTFATHASRSTDIASLGEITGHKDISVLLNRYMKGMDEAKRRGVASLPWANVGPKSVPDAENSA